MFCISKTPDLWDIAAKPNFSNAIFSSLIKSGCFCTVLLEDPSLNLLTSFGGCLSADRAKSSTSDPTHSPNSTNLSSI